MTEQLRGGSSANTEDPAPVAYLPWVQPGNEPNNHPAARALASDPSAAGVFSSVSDELTAVDRADALVLARLARKGLSRREVEVELRHELNETEIEIALARYERLGYLDDQLLAEHIVRVERERKGKGISAVRRELEIRGIPTAITHTLLAEFDTEQDLERATQLAAARLRRHNSEPREVQTRRLFAFLQRRGFDSSTISAAIRAAQQSNASGSDFSA